MDPKFVPLLYLCSLSGVVMVVGGILLVYKQKIYIDRESQQVTEIETPIGKFKTNIPALVLFALGFVPLIYPIARANEFRDKLRISGTVRSNVLPVQVYAVSESEALLQGRDFSLQVPRLDTDYKVLYVAGSLLFEDRADQREIKQGQIVLPAKEIKTADPVTFKPQVAPVPPEF